MTKDLTVDEALERLRQEARRVHQDQLRPDGQVIELHIYGPGTVGLPSVQIRLMADGTWGYVR